MKTKSVCLTACLMIAIGAFSQTSDTLLKSSAGQPKIPDSLISMLTLQKDIPDSLLQRFKIQTEVPDTSSRQLIAQYKSSDTLQGEKSPASKPSEAKAPVRKYDKRWNISPLLKFQAQDFGMLEKRRMGYLSDAHTLSFTDRSTLSLAASVYKNFSGHPSMSLDIGAGSGRVTDNDAPISQAQKRFYGVGTATMYLHLLGGQYRLQPFIAAGINYMMGNGAYMSAPVGAGVKFTGKKIMIEGQAAQGYAISKNIANTMMYSVGAYIPLKRKKDDDEESSNRKDSGNTKNITNITNNYYLLNADSLKKAAADSAKLAEEQLKKKREADANKILDPDDPMNLPAAVKEIVYFNYDQYSLTSAAFGSIDQVIKKLKDNPILNVHLKGYTDLSGSEQYNSALSRRRAQMVFDYMNSRGIPAERMIMSGYGKNNPAIASNDPGTAWMNRRCEIVIFEKR